MGYGVNFWDPLDPKNYVLKGRGHPPPIGLETEFMWIDKSEHRPGLPRAHTIVRWSYWLSQSIVIHRNTTGGESVTYLRPTWVFM